MSVRSATLLLTFTGVVGCVSRFEANPPPPPIRCDQPYYLDNDQDGWGAATSEAQVLCEGNLESRYTATNARDCDDDDAAITGRVAGACPADLVTGGASYRGLSYNDKEYVIIYGDADVVGAAEAAAACGERGWGGQLATFDEVAEVAEVQGALNELFGFADIYAGFIGVTVNETRTDWTWADGSTLDLLDIGFCDGQRPLVLDATFGIDWLALVKQADSGSEDWCLSTPRAALRGTTLTEPAYDDRKGHFICERPTPRAAEYPVYPEPGTVGGESDTATE